MTAFKHAKHGHHHRPEGFYGPDDPGGPDPLPFLTDAPGPWHYVLPISPAEEPDDLIADDPLAGEFQGSWSNIAGRRACSYRFLDRANVQWRIDATGGEDDPGSVIFTFPASFAPDATDVADGDRLVAVIGADGTGLGTVDVTPDAEAVFVNEITGQAGAPGEAADSGIFFELDQTGGWLDITTTAQDGSGYGIYLQANDGEINIAASNGDITVGTDGTLFLFSSTGISVGSSALLEIGLGGGGLVRILDSSSNPIFEVRDDGTVHILTGGTIVADL